MNSLLMATRKNASVVTIVESLLEEGVSKASNLYFDTQLRVASYRAITRLLAKEGLISNDEEQRISKHLTKMKDKLIRANRIDRLPHNRDIAITE